VKLILASTSPRRADLLRQAGYAFEVHAAAIDEDQYLNKMWPRKLAAFLARVKAERVADRFPADVTLAADTVVSFGDTAVGKPADEAAAREMMRLLSFTTHIVITGVAVHCPDRKVELAGTALSAVRMRPLSNAEIDRYVASGLWKGKAGGYGIQDPDPLVTCVGGSLTNVIGLPMTLTKRLLTDAGILPGESQVARIVGDVPH
jgi:septum formation protein